MEMNLSNTLIMCGLIDHGIYVYKLNCASSCRAATSACTLNDSAMMKIDDTDMMMNTMMIMMRPLLHDMQSMTWSI